LQTDLPPMTDLETRSETHSEKDSPTPTAKGRHWLKDSDLRKPMEMHSATDFRSHSDLGLLTHLDLATRSRSVTDSRKPMAKRKATGFQKHSGLAIRSRMETG